MLCFYALETEINFCVNKLNGISNVKYQKLWEIIFITQQMQIVEENAITHIVAWNIINGSLENKQTQKHKVQQKD